MPHVLHWAPQEEIEEHTQTSHPQYNFESPTRPITFLVDGELHTIAVPILPVWRITVPQTEYRPTPQLRFRHIGPVPPIHFDYIGQQQGSGMLYLDGLNSQDRALVIQNGSDVLFEGIDGKYIYIILEMFANPPALAYTHARKVYLYDRPGGRLLTRAELFERIKNEARHWIGAYRAQAAGDPEGHQWPRGLVGIMNEDIIITHISQLNGKLFRLHLAVWPPRNLAQGVPESIGATTAPAPLSITELEQNAIITLTALAEQRARAREATELCFRPHRLVELASTIEL